MNTTKALAKHLTKHKLTLSLAESCTGGLIAKTLTDIPGSSAFLTAGFITYANEAKIMLLKVPRSRIVKYGAVSGPVARAMAEGCRKVTGTDLSVAVTGIAGPGGGTAEKPVGLVFIAVARANETIIQTCYFKGNRAAVRAQAAETALRLLIETLS